MMLGEGMLYSKRKQISGFGDLSLGFEKNISAAEKTFKTLAFFSYFEQYLKRESWYECSKIIRVQYASDFALLLIFVSKHSWVFKVLALTVDNLFTFCWLELPTLGIYIALNIQHLPFADDTSLTAARETLSEVQYCPEIT